MLFDLDRVCVERRGRAVLTDLTGSVPEGATAVVGPSGAGKSTLLRLLNRLAEPISGQVRYRGTPLPELPVLAHRREVGLVPQTPTMLDGTVGENLTIGARLAGIALDAPALLVEVGLDPAFADRPAARLSVGEGQRLMLARALALAPRVLLLDEPTAALDDDSREQVEATLLRRAAEGLSIVVVTHDLAQAWRLAPDCVLRLDGAGLVAQGRPAGRPA